MTAGEALETGVPRRDEPLAENRDFRMGIGLAGLSLVFAPVRALRTARLQPRAAA